MTITITGSAGVDFDVTENDTDTSTGSKTVQHSVDTALKNLSLTDADLVNSVSGTVGTTPFEIDLNDLQDQSGAGFSVKVECGQNIDYTTIKKIVFHNKNASNNLIIGSPASDSFYTWNTTSDTRQIDPNSALSDTYTVAKVVGTSGKITIVADSADTEFEFYILGT